MNTAISDRLIESTVKLTSEPPRRAASRGSIPASMWRTMFSTTTTASSTTKPVAMVSAISEEDCRCCSPSRHIRPEAAEDGQQQDRRRYQRGARGGCRNTNTTPITSNTAKNNVRSVSPTAADTDCERSDAMCTSMLGGRVAVIEGNTFTRSAGQRCLMILAPGSGKIHDTDRPACRCTPRPALQMIFSLESSTSATSCSSTCSAVAVGDHQVAIIRGLARLIIGNDLVALVALINVAFGAIRVGRTDCTARTSSKPDAVTVREFVGNRVRPVPRATPLPPSVIWPTPVICESCCWMMVSAES